MYRRVTASKLLMKQSAFPYMKLERKVLFRKADIDKWLESKMIR
jgi:predicted DNA-binding transcriptional regulator AlpA